MPDAAISARAIGKAYRVDRKALDAVPFEIAPDGWVALIDASGSGKSTLPRHSAGFVLANPVPGPLAIDGSVAKANGRISPDVRRVRAGIGIAFQKFKHDTGPSERKSETDPG